MNESSNVLAQFVQDATQVTLISFVVHNSFKTVQTSNTLQSFCIGLVKFVKQIIF